MYVILQVLVVGAGPCGLRMAIEAALLGASPVMVVELRGYLSRNNGLHLWPFVMDDLRRIGAKVFYPKFGNGQIDHISRCITTVGLQGILSFSLVSCGTGTHRQCSSGTVCMEHDETVYVLVEAETRIFGFFV